MAPDREYVGRLEPAAQPFHAALPEVAMDGKTAERLAGKTVAAPSQTGLRRTLARTLPWLLKGGLAILDQGLFAGTNFLANILLARWLSADQYGAFALAYAAFLFCGLFHSALITEPMMVFGPGKYSLSQAGYFAVLARLQTCIAVGLGLILACVAAMAGWLYGARVGWAMAGAALAAPCILSLWVVRRAFYVRLRPAWAVAAGALYCVLVLSFLVPLRLAGRLSPATGLAGMGAAALIAAVALGSRLCLRRGADRGGPDFREVIAGHWRYGRWTTAAAPVAWLPEGIYFIILPAGFGLAEAGALKALVNFAMPVLQSISALGLLLLPLLVRALWNGGASSMGSPMRRFLGVFVSGGLLYALLLSMFRLPALQLVYVGKYNQYAAVPMLLTALLPLALCCAEPFEAGLRALERPDLMFRSNVVGALVCLACGVPMAARLGVSGALAGMLLSRSAVAASNFLYYTRETSRAIMRGLASDPRPEVTPS